MCSILTKFQMVFNKVHTFLELNVQVRDLLKPRCGMHIGQASRLQGLTLIIKVYHIMLSTEATLVKVKQIITDTLYKGDYTYNYFYKRRKLSSILNRI